MLGNHIESEKMQTKSLITETTVLAEMLQDQYCSVFPEHSEEQEIPNISELFDNYDESHLHYWT